MSQIKQVIILAGGKGIRMREMTHDLPKPMVKIGDLTVLDHLINIFQAQGEFEFVICTGYLGEVIEEYYKNKRVYKLSLQVMKPIRVEGFIKSEIY